jgi:hypothetical protein
MNSNDERWNANYGSKWHSAADHGPDRRDIHMKVIDAYWEVIENRINNTREEKIVLDMIDVRSQSRLKSFPLNKTNGKALAAATGSRNPDDYKGVTGVLRVVGTTQGDGVRVQVTGRAGQAQQPLRGAGLQAPRMADRRPAPQGAFAPPAEPEEQYDDPQYDPEQGESVFAPGQLDDGVGDQEADPPRMRRGSYVYDESPERNRVREERAKMAERRVRREQTARDFER